MQPPTLRVLLAGRPDDRIDRLRALLDSVAAEIELNVVESAADALDALRHASFDLCLIDATLTEEHVGGFLDEVARTGHLMPVYVVASAPGQEQATSMLSLGAAGVLDQIEAPVVDQLLHAARMHRTSSRSLRQERQFLNTVLDETAILIAVLDRRGRVVRFNWAAEQATGIASADAFARYFWDLFEVEGERSEVQARLGDIRPGRFPMRFRQAWTTAGGRRLLVEWSVTALADQDGALSGLVCTGQDLTELAGAMEQVRLHRELLHGIVAGAPFALFAVDRAGALLLTEGEVLQRLAPGAGHLRGQSVFDLYGDVPRLGECVRRALDGELVSDVLEIDAHVFEMHAAPIRQGRQSIGATVVATDVTQQYRARESLTRIRKAVEAASDAIGITDVSGEALYHNRALVHLLGYSVEQLNSRGGLSTLFLDPGDAAAIVQTVRGGEPWDGEVWMRARNGRVVRVHLRADAIRDDDGRLMSVHRDLTEIEQARMDAERSEARLQRALEAARMGVWDWDLETGLMSWFGMVETLFAADPNEFASSFDEFVLHVHPDDRVGVRQAAQRALAGEEDYAPVFRFVLPGGRERLVESRGKVFVDDEGRPMRMTGVVLLSERTG